MTVRDRAKTLAPIRVFDSDALRSSPEFPPEVCQLIIALAVIYNDCRDLGLWSDDLLKARPEAVRSNRYQGELGGQTFHCFRLLVGVIHELGELVRTNTDAMYHPAFRALVDRLPDREANMWKRVLDLSFGRRAEKIVDELLKELRNSTAFHYDQKDLAAGFDRKFPSGSTDPQQRPFFSRGDLVETVRFYFADAAATAVLETQIEALRLTPFGKRLSETLRDVSVTIALLVEGFIEARMGSHAFAEENGPTGEVDDLSQ